MNASFRIGSAIVAALCISALPLSGFAQNAQKYPSKPIRLVTASAASQTDIVARIIGARVSEGLGQPVVIENRAGAGGAIGANIVAKAAPDGYTLLLQSGQFAIRAAIHVNLPYDSIKDFAGVSLIGFSTQVLLVSPSLGPKSAKEFIAYAKARPDQMLFSTSGAGTGTHMDVERFRFAAGIKAKHVAFKATSESLIEVVAGRTHFTTAPLGPAFPLIKDGKLLALAVNTPQRSPQLPDVPAMAEVLPGWQRDGSYVLMAPAKTPRPILNQLAKEVARVLDLPDVKEQLRVVGFVPAASTPEELDRILRADIETFTKVAKLVGLRAQ
jgi:tripartite-type tricarboxylate transporter receptor subunit TctC